MNVKQKWVFKNSERIILKFNSFLARKIDLESKKTEENKHAYEAARGLKYLGRHLE